MTFKAFLGYAKSVGTAIGAWLWLIKILAGVLGLALLFAWLL